MSQPKGTCPVCEKKIMPGEDAVVCPDCGAPYHRTCYLQAGNCVFADKHGTGFEYKPAKEEEKKTAPGAAEGYSAPTAPCPNCGTQNNTRNIFCDNCGTPLHNQRQSAPNAPPPGGHGFPGYGASGPYGPGQNPPNSPAGGQPMFNGYPVDLSGEIDDIPKKDWNVFIGRSSPTYLLRLGQQDQRKSKIGFMLSAFFIPHFYFAFRKMWGLAALTTALWLVFNLPAAGIFLAQSGYSVLGLTMAQLESLSNATYFANLLLQFVTGLFGLWLYRRDAGKKMKRLRDEHMDEPAYQAALQRKGGVSWAGVAIVFLVIVAFFIMLNQFISPEVLYNYMEMYFL